jgi:hypothetical protein
MMSNMPVVTEPSTSDIYQEVSKVSCFESGMAQNTVSCLLLISMQTTDAGNCLPAMVY